MMTESLPPEKSSTGRSNSAATSRTSPTSPADMAATAPATVTTSASAARTADPCRAGDATTGAGCSAMSTEGKRGGDGARLKLTYDAIGGTSQLGLLQGDCS